MNMKKEQSLIENSGPLPIAAGGLPSVALSTSGSGFNEMASLYHQTVCHGKEASLLGAGEKERSQDSCCLALCSPPK